MMWLPQSLQGRRRVGHDWLGRAGEQRTAGHGDTPLVMDSEAVRVVAEIGVADRTLTRFQLPAFAQGKSPARLA